MKAEDFFTGSDKQATGVCILYSYGIAINYVTKLSPQTVACLCCASYNGDNFWKELKEENQTIDKSTISGYSFIELIHEANTCMLKSTIIANRFVEFKEELWHAFEKRKSLQATHFEIGGLSKSDSIEKCTQLIKDNSVNDDVTAILCLNPKDINNSHSIAVTYDSEKEVFIIRDPNYDKNECSKKLGDLTDEVVKRTWPSIGDSYHIGDLLLFKKKPEPLNDKMSPFLNQVVAGSCEEASPNLSCAGSCSPNPKRTTANPLDNLNPSSPLESVDL